MFGRALLALLAPACVLAGAYLLVPVVGDLPAGLKAHGAYVVLAAGAIVSLAFRRGRAALALLTLAVAYASLELTLQVDPAGFPARTVFAALAVFVPFNLAVLSVLEERGTFNLHGAQRLGVIVLESIFVWWIVATGRTETTNWAWAPLHEALRLAWTPIPQLGLTALALGFAACAAAWAMRRTPVTLGLTGSVLAFGIAMHRVAQPEAFAVFIAAGALILTIAVLQDTFQMAYRDELTGLPSRRELNERLRSLGRRYTIAMVDVDKFKSFNDKYGHDLGDQVLKMVAAKLAAVGGGGKAYRYGGEEFTVLFPGKDLDAVMPHLEALREAVADYRLALRAPSRPQKTESVTISIGVAERNDKLDTPEAVIKAADQALYRAKRGVRNQVRK